MAAFGFLNTFLIDLTCWPFCDPAWPLWPWSITSYCQQWLDSQCVMHPALCASTGYLQNKFSFWFKLQHVSCSHSSTSLPKKMKQDVNSPEQFSWALVALKEKSKLCISVAHILVQSEGFSTPLGILRSCRSWKIGKFLRDLSARQQLSYLMRATQFDVFWGFSRLALAKRRHMRCCIRENVTQNWWIRNTQDYLPGLEKRRKGDTAGGKNNIKSSYPRWRGKIFSSVNQKKMKIHTQTEERHISALSVYELFLRQQKIRRKRIFQHSLRQIQIKKFP